MVRLLFFGRVREAVGAGEAALPLAGPTPLDAALERVAALSPAHAEALADRAQLRFALNHEIVGPDTIVRPGDELAIFSPVTGG